MTSFQLYIDGTVFRSNGSEVVLRGINLAADSKLPRHPDQSSHEPTNFFDGDNVSFVGRPFDLDDAYEHFRTLREWGFNTLRYIFTWEAIEAPGPSQYDEDWIQHTISVVKLARKYGFYVIMDPHQDVWSRFTGGSGAPMWTLYACGLNPEAFATTEAALVHNTWPDPSKFPKMIWATNYQRLACATMFTLFWAGREFAPRAIIDGKNIQDYLQDHFISACKHLAQRIREAGDLMSSTIIGWENINEPNRGMVGTQDITVIPPDQQLKKGTTPTAWQTLLTGSGVACEVETWDFGSTGPYKTGKQLVDPRGTIAWLPKDYDDSRYGWKRDPEWKLGKCLWAQQGIWNPAANELLRKDYFAKDPRTGAAIDHEYFTNHWLMDGVRTYKAAIREVQSDAILFLEPPVNELPPTFQKNSLDADPNVVYTPHWYDGLTLMTKKWNRLWNVDIIGVMRGRYLTPALAIKIGETAIRNCFRDQLGAMRKEGMDNMGPRPCLFSEFGIPYDMEDGKAYRTGDYSGQLAAMDANWFAIEGNKLNCTLWTYAASNNHQWGDNWNGEDLSIHSRDDEIPPPSVGYAKLKKKQGAQNSGLSTPTASNSPESLLPADPQAPLLQPPMTATPSPKTSDPKTSDPKTPHHYRAAAAFIRPYPIATWTDLISYSFTLKTVTFAMKLNAKSACPEDRPTEIFLPDFHYAKGEVKVDASDGWWEVVKEVRGDADVQMLRWWHGAGEHTLKAIGVVRPKVVGKVVGEEGGGWGLERCLERACGVM